MERFAFKFKSICLIFIALSILLIKPQIAYADTSGDYTYNVEGNSATIIKYNGSGGDIIIPATLGGYLVTTIGNSAFQQNTKLISVTIPESVTAIGDGAFYNCTSLMGINIPNSVINIGNNAFDGCYKLMSVLIGNSVTNIGNNAFTGCSYLSNITIPESVTNIGIGAFGGCPRLTSITVDERNIAYCSMDGILYNKSKTNLIIYPISKIGSLLIIPDGVTSISNCAFSNCKNLNSVIIPDSVTSIGSYAFSCTNLNSVTIPDGVTRIESSTFSGCTGLSSINIPKSVTSIGGDAFVFCSNLNSVNIPDGVTSIGSEAFCYCYGLNSVTIPDSVTSIGFAAFYNCSSLNNVEIPKSITSIADNAFYNCSNLTIARFLGNAPTIGSNVFYNCNPYLKIYYLNGSTGFTNPWYWYPTEPFYIYTVTFDSMNGDAKVVNTVYYVSQITAPKVPTRTGYTFGGWYKEVECINAWNFATDKVTTDTTLYPKWIANPTVPASVKTTSSSYNSINTSWGAVTGASGYEIYRATSSTGTYTLISTTTAISYNNTGLTTNSTYYYKVRAYRMVGTVKVYSSFSTVVSAKPIPSTPINLKAIRVSSTRIKLTWSGVSGATGYEIYRATSSIGTYSLIKTATEGRIPNG